METDINGPTTAGERPSAVSSDNNFSRQTAHTTVPSSRNTRTMSSTNNNTGNTSTYTSRQTSNENTSKASSANCYRPCDIFLDNDNAATFPFTLPIIDAKSKECTASLFASLIAPLFASLLTLIVGVGMYPLLVLITRVSVLLALIFGVSMQTKECLSLSLSLRLRLPHGFALRCSLPDCASLMALPFGSLFASLLILTVGTGMCPLLVLIAGIDMQTKECLSLSLSLRLRLPHGFALRCSLPDCASLMALPFGSLSAFSLRLCLANGFALRCSLSDCASLTASPLGSLSPIVLCSSLGPSPCSWF
jgi:hypothetical protein